MNENGGQYGDKVVAIACSDQDPAKLKRFIKQHGLESLTFYHYKNGSVDRAYGVKSIPHSVLIDDNFNVIRNKDANLIQLKLVAGTVQENKAGGGAAKRPNYFPNQAEAPAVKPERTKIVKAEYKDVEAIFAHVDKNKNGRISVPELMDCMKKAGKLPQKRQERIKNTLMKEDSDADGTLTVKELDNFFTRLLSTEGKKSADEMGASLKRYFGC